MLVTFCTHVGWDGVLLLLFPLGISGLFVYITFVHKKLSSVALPVGLGLSCCWLGFTFTGGKVFVFGKNGGAVFKAGE